MSADRGGPKRPRFVEAITNVRHANTVVHRLGSVSGLRNLPEDPVEEAEHTVFSSTAETIDLGTDPAVRLPGVALPRTPMPPAPLPPAPLPPTPLPPAPRPPAPRTPVSPTAPQSPAASPTPAVRPLNDATSRQIELPPSADVDDAHGKIIVVFACRGGAGATTVAVNLAAILAGQPRGCVIIDLDLQMGDVLCALDLQPTATIADVLDDIDLLDASSLRRRLTPHRTGLFALSQADRFDQLEMLQADRVPGLLVGLARQFDAVIIDGLRDFSDLSISALDKADQILLVVPEDVAGVKNASRCLDVFRRLGYDSSKISLVINRHEPKALVTPAAVAETLKIEPVAVLGTSAQAQRALDEGVPLVERDERRSQVVPALRQLAARLRGEPAEPSTPPQAGGWFARMFGGRR